MFEKSRLNTQVNNLLLADNNPLASLVGDIDKSGAFYQRTCAECKGNAVTQSVDQAEVWWNEWLAKMQCRINSVHASVRVWMGGRYKHVVGVGGGGLTECVKDDHRDA